jgi:hypothetical protein
MWPWAGTVHTLVFACINTGLAAGMYLYGRFPPYYGFKEPSEEDKNFMRSGQFGLRLRGNN